MRITTKLPLLATVAALAAAVALPAAAPAASIKRGVYDCSAYDYFSGFSLYKGSVKFVSGSRYQHAWGRKGKKMEDPTAGRYRIKGKKIKFKGGAMQHTPGRISSRTQFEVWVDGQASGVSCYRVKNP